VTKSRNDNRNDIYNSLISSIIHKQIEMVNHILSLPLIETDTANAIGTTPLIAAININNEDIVLKLLQLKCNRHAKDLNGYTALQHAINNRFLFIYFSI
jgi:ankyrin repeat protein